MELWKSIEILRNKKRNWLLGKNNDDERINALNNILDLGLPSAISYLIPFLKDKNSEIKNLTCLAIVELFDKISSKKSFYETLKHSEISKSDIDFYKNYFSEKEYIILLAIASLNYNGYVREKAVKKLVETQNPLAIQFIIYRLADWVQNVREVASKGLVNYKKIEFIDGLIENFETLEWLRSVERTDLNSFYTGIKNFIIIQNKKHVLDNFKSYSDKTRIIVAKQLSDTNDVELNDLQILISDKHFIVRNFALKKFNKLTKVQINQLLNDKSARVRYETLFKLKETPDFKEIALNFIADNSATIRNFSRFILKDDISDFASIYNDNLQNNRNILGSIIGLSEINGIKYIPTVESFLNNKSIRVKKFAFLSLKNLDETKAYGFALSNLDTQFLGLRNLIINFLETKATNEVLDKAREIYQNGDFDLKKSMLKLFSKIGKWTTIADLMIGTIDENENIRNLSVQYVKNWKTKATSYFTQPKLGELERANQILNFVYELHEEKQYYPHNPLSGIDFYLK